MLSGLITMQVVVNFSILGQVETSEAPLHFTAMDTEIQKGELDLSKITGWVSAWIFFFLITNQGEEKN